MIGPIASVLQWADKLTEEELGRTMRQSVSRWLDANTDRAIGQFFRVVFKAINETDVVDRVTSLGTSPDLPRGQN